MCVIKLENRKSLFPEARKLIVEAQQVLNQSDIFHLFLLLFLIYFIIIPRTLNLQKYISVKDNTCSIYSEEKI